MSGSTLWLAYVALSALSLIGAVMFGLNGDAPATLAFVGSMWFFSNRSNSVEDLVS